MRYVSIDIETTGLDPDKHQVIQVGAVIDGPEYRNTHIQELPTFKMGIKHSLYSGDAYALAMNSQILSGIANGTMRSEDPSRCWELFNAWLVTHAFSHVNKVVAAGKNFASFDRQFLRRMWPSFNERFHYRSIDPAMFFIRPDDTEPPSTAICLMRAQMGTTVLHDAVEDARQVVQLIRYSGRVN